MISSIDGGEGEATSRGADALAPVIPLFGAGSHPGDPASSESDTDAAAETLLLRRLNTRQLSISEARTVVIEAGMAAGAVEELLERFERLGYLDDRALTEQLVHAAVERKRQGRHAIAPALTRRGLPREVIAAALAELPDDDADRALEFARTKARGLGARDRDAALRRLMGQLARRGYPSSVSLAAARQALDEI